MDLVELIEVLQVEPVGPDELVGRSPADRRRPVYGGQFLAQALLAAAHTVETGRVPHSLHAYFVRSGDASAPIHYAVERVRDGRSFSHRSVVARQDGREVFRQILSFQVPGSGLGHQASFPIEPGIDPSTLPDYRAWVEAMSDNTEHDWFREVQPVELRIEDPPPARPRAPIADTLRIWIRAVGEVPTDDPVIHAALLAWMSDKTLSDVVMYPHARSWTDTDFDVLSLDHTMHFFEPCRADQWTLFTHETPATGGGRGLARGDMVRLDGRRVGSLSQEALLVAPPVA